MSWMPSKISYRGHLGAVGALRVDATSHSLAYLVTATFFHFASLYYLVPTLPLYVSQLGGSTLEVGLIIGVLTLTSLGARPFVGASMDRTGRRGFLLAGAAIYVLASLGYWAIRSVPVLLFWRVFHGLGLAAFSTAAASLAADLAPPGRRGTTMGLFGLAQAAALTVGPGIGQAALHTLGYPGLFLAAASTACASLVCSVLLPPIPFQSARSVAEPGASEWALREMGAAPPTVQFAASVAYGTIISFIAVVARDRGLETVGTFFALLALSSFGIRLAAGKAYDAWGPIVVLTPLFGILAIGMAMVAVATDPVVFLLAAVLSGVGIGGTHTTLLAWVVDRSTPGRRARSVATFAACWELGVGGGTVIMGQLAEAAGFDTMFLVVAALPLLGLGGLRWLGGPGSRATRSGEGSESQGGAPAPHPPK